MKEFYLIIMVISSILLGAGMLMYLEGKRNAAVFNLVILVVILVITAIITVIMSI